MEKFWMVLRADTAGRGPVVRHETWAQAVEEAKRLALRERTHFIVLEAVDLVTITWEEPRLDVLTMEMPRETIGSPEGAQEAVGASRTIEGNEGVL